MARANKPARAYQLSADCVSGDWYRTEMWAYVHVSPADPEALVKKAFFSHDKYDLVTFVEAYVRKDAVLREGVSEDQFHLGLENHNYGFDGQDYHVVKQVIVHSIDGDFRGPLMMLYWQDDMVDHVVKHAEIHAFADAKVVEEWAFAHVEWAADDVRKKLVAAAEKNEGLCLPPSADRRVVADGACLVCECPILCREDEQEGDELSLLLNDMISVEPGDGSVPSMDQQLFLEPHHGAARTWKVSWKPYPREVDFPADNKEDAEKHRGGIFKQHTKELQSYRVIKGIMQRFDRIEQAIEQLTGEMRFLPPAHGGAEYWKTSRKFGKGYRSE